MSSALVFPWLETILSVSIRWHLQGVFLELKNGQQIPLFEHSGENGNEVKKGLNVTKKTQFSPGIAFPHHYILSMASSQFSSYPGGWLYVQAYCNVGIILIWQWRLLRFYLIRNVYYYIYNYFEVLCTKAWNSNQRFVDFFFLVLTSFLFYAPHTPHSFQLQREE